MHSKEICKRRLTAKARETQSVILSPKDYYVVSLPMDSAKLELLTKRYLVHTEVSNGPPPQLSRDLH
jgi:hypothetical protein